MRLGLRERVERLEPREQRLLFALVGVFGVMLVLLVPVLLSATAASRRGENEAIRDAMAAIEKARPELDVQDSVRQKVLGRYAHPTPPLAGFLEQLATAHGIEIPESQDQPLIKHGKKFEERSTKLVLQKVGMKNLSMFLEAIETSGNPVRVSYISLRKRATEPDSYDVSLAISAYDRKEPEKKAAPAASGEAKEGPP